MMHRRFRDGYTLCGIKANKDNATLDDNEVTCTKCNGIMDKVKYTDTKTTDLYKIRAKLKEEQDETSTE